MNAPTKNHVISALKHVKTKNGSNIVDAGIVPSIVIHGTHVGFAINVDGKNLNSQESETLRQLCEQEVAKIPGVDKVTAVLTAEKPRPYEQPNLREIAGVKKTILIASGKGGVGKSTVTYNLSHYYTKKYQNNKVGIIDADIYGPSIPKLFANDSKPQINATGLIQPLSAKNIDFISIGNLTDSKEGAIIWRGPMATKAIFQLFTAIAWQDIDILFVDMPPGTSDIQLSIAKNFVIDGAILVTTPEDIAIIDVIKAADMFLKLNIKIIGVIENMSYFKTPKSDEKHYIFGKGGGKTIAKKFNIPLLGQIPILPHFDTNNKKELEEVYNQIIDKITARP